MGPVDPDAALAVERALVLAARDAVPMLPITGTTAAGSWMDFCIGLAREVYPLIETGERLDAVSDALAAVADACIRVSPALAQDRMVTMLTWIRGEEGLRNSSRRLDQPKARLMQLVPPAAQAAMDVVWAEELAAFRRDSSGY